MTLTFTAPPALIEDDEDAATITEAAEDAVGTLRRIARGRSDTGGYLPRDRAIDLARAFCNRHGLPFDRRGEACRRLVRESRGTRTRGAEGRKPRQGGEG